MEHLQDWLPTCCTSTNEFSFEPDGSVVNPRAFLKFILSRKAFMKKIFKTDPELANVFYEEDVMIMQEILRECSRLRIQQQPNHGAVPAAVVRPFETEADTHQVKFYTVIEVNGCSLEALVDTTAQSTIMPISYVQRCGLLGLVDQNYKSIVAEVGHLRILGRVHSARFKVEGKLYRGSFLVVDSPPDMDFVFGIDMMREHKCVVDFEMKVLKFYVREVSVPLYEDKDTAVATHAKGPKPTPISGIRDGAGLIGTFEDKVEGLTLLGYERETVIKVLEENGYDTFKAIQVLISQEYSC